MKASTTIGLLAATLLIGAATTAHAQKRSGETRFNYEHLEWLKLPHVDAEEGAIGVALTKDLPKNASRADRRALNRIVRDLKAGNSRQANDKWIKFTTSYVSKISKTGNNRDTATNTNAMIQWVLRESYIEPNEDLKDRANKVRYLNDLKKRIRDEIATMREMRSGMSADARVFVRKMKVDLKSVNGKDAVTFGSPT